MPLCNRVDPFGTICTVPQRGNFMGNRGGRIHDPLTKTLLKRNFASIRWIICQTAFKNRQRTVMGAGYTELFFLDEVTALAAGHRPCAECQRAAYNSFRVCCAIEGKVEVLDEQLHQQRLGPNPHYANLFKSGAPDGLMVAIGDVAFAKRGKDALRWSFDGYAEDVSWEMITTQNLQVLTPPLTITAFQNGYAPVWHPSAAV
jgi:hypothetical protein